MFCFNLAPFTLIFACIHIPAFVKQLGTKSACLLKCCIHKINVFLHSPFLMFACFCITWVSPQLTPISKIIYQSIKKQENRKLLQIFYLRNKRQQHDYSHLNCDDSLLWLDLDQSTAEVEASAAGWSRWATGSQLDVFWLQSFLRERKGVAASSWWRGTHLYV